MNCSTKSCPNDAADGYMLCDDCLIRLECCSKIKIVHYEVVEWFKPNDKMPSPGIVKYVWVEDGIFMAYHINGEWLSIDLDRPIKVLYWTDGLKGPK